MSTPQIPADLGRQATDLGEVKRRADERAAAEKVAAEQAEYQSAVGRARAWDRAMRRTFKGIATPASRRYNLSRAMAKMEAADDAE
jgi:hypothetical protein